MAAILSCEVKYAGKITGNIAVTQAYFRQSLKDAWNRIGWHLFEKYVARHFTREGAAEYRSDSIAGDGPVYQPRSGEGQSGRAFWKSYNGRKQKNLGHQLALVFSGRTRDGARRATISATSGGVTVTLPGVVHINQYKPRVKKHGPHAGEPPIDIRGDLLAISRREREEMRDLHERIMIDKWGKQFLEKHVVRI